MNSDSPDPNTRRVVEFLGLLRHEVDTYYSDLPKGPATYEDLYYVSDQIRGSESGHIDNPGLGALIEKLRLSAKHVMGGTTDLQVFPWTLERLADETCNYIRDVAWHLIADKSYFDSSYLSFLMEACRSVSNVDIFTLNHDLLIESILAEHKVAFCDGFGVPINGTRYWLEGEIESTPVPVRLFKLHGSINWFEFLSDGKWLTGIPETWDVWHAIGPTGGIAIPNGGRPKFLAGTGNKPLEYRNGLFVELHHEFHRGLRVSRRLVVAGYGFGDQGINNVIFEWLSSNPESRMVVVHHEPSSLRSRGRWNIAGSWLELEAKGQIRFVSKKAEDVSWPEISAALDGSVAAQSDELRLAR